MLVGCLVVVVGNFFPSSVVWHSRFVGLGFGGLVGVVAFVLVLRLRGLVGAFGGSLE